MENGIPFVSVENISNINDYNKYISKEAYTKEFSNNHPIKGDILMTRIGDIGTPALIKENLELAYYVSLARISLNDTINSNYIYFYIQTYKFQHELWKKTIHVAFPKKINKDDIGECIIQLPSSKDYQKTISYLMLLIEDKINTQKKIIEDLYSLKKQIINNLFSGVCKKAKLSEFLTQISKRNKNDAISNVLSVSNKNGFVKQFEQFEDRVVASDNKSNYKIIEYNMFAYNPARINVGSIARYDKLEEGIISPMYVCFTCKENLDSIYFEYFLESCEFKNEMIKRLEGSVRQCLTFESFANIPFIALPLEIQKKNAAVITAFTKKINLENDYLENLVLQKNYLLSKLFI